MSSFVCNMGLLKKVIVIFESSIDFMGCMISDLA